MTEVPGHPDLWEILDSGQNRCRDAQYVCPCSEVVWLGDDQSSADDDDSEPVQKADTSYSDCSLPCVLLLLQLIDRKRRTSWEEDKEEKQAIIG